jgi:hypothetical protein
MDWTLLKKLMSSFIHYLSERSKYAVKCSTYIASFDKWMNTEHWWTGIDRGKQKFSLKKDFPSAALSATALACTFV